MMRANLKMKAGGYADRETRIAVRYPAVVIEMDGCELPVEITDVSREGFGLVSNCKLDPGQEIWLSVSNSSLAPLRAIIQWTRGNEAGGVFLDPVAL
ncbi:MAG TPA: PilZ domain-containing protein [Sphingomicrobium sp.]